MATSGENYWPPTGRTSWPLTAKDEVIRTEVSTKFTRELIESEFVLAGLTPADWWSDGDYALALARKDA